jgi:proteic killer suppression protein
VKGLDRQIQQRVREKLKYLAAAADLRDLTFPPSNLLERLMGGRQGQHSIRINRQWRVCFKWKDGDAFASRLLTTTGVHKEGIAHGNEEATSGASGRYFAA